MVIEMCTCAAGRMGESMTVFIFEVEEDFTKRQHLKWVLEIKVQSSSGGEMAF